MYPKNKEEARKIMYGANSYKRGVPYDETHCAAEVWDKSGWGSYQCTHKANCGIFCKVHARKAGHE